MTQFDRSGLRIPAILLIALPVFSFEGCKEKNPPPDSIRQIDIPPEEKSPNAINAA